MKLFPVILLLFVLASCRPCKEISSTIIENDTLIIVKDTMIVIPADSAFIAAYFECDSTNKVVMSQLETLKGKKVTPVIKFRDQWLTVVAKVDSEQVYIKWKELHTSNSNIVQETKIEVRKVYPKWLIVLASMGALALLYVIGVIVFRIMKIIKPL